MDADEIVDVESASPAAHLTEHEVIPRPRACTVLSPPGRLPEEVPPRVSLTGLSAVYWAHVV